MTGVSYQKLIFIVIVSCLLINAIEVYTFWKNWKQLSYHRNITSGLVTQNSTDTPTPGLATLNSTGKPTLLLRKGTGVGPNIQTNMTNRKLHAAISVKTTTEVKAIKIAFYRPYHGIMIRHMNEFDSSACVHKNCLLYNEMKISKYEIDADAVIFQANHMPPQLPIHRDTDQVFIVQAMETPQYLQVTSLAEPIFVNYFNWTMTYRLDSDIHFPYGSIIPKSSNSSLDINKFTLRGNVNESRFYEDMKDELLWANGKDYSALFKGKSKTAAWLVSHCTTASKREKYVQQMSRYTDIDIYGRCSNLSCPRNKSCTDMVVHTYKFYISFENSMCADYITEKTFSWFPQDIIIVVRGGRFYERHLPKGTFIDSSDFKSPKDLANYLSELGSNETEYIKYLQRKDHFVTINEKRRTQIAYCELCRRLNDLDRYRGYVNDINKWWQGNGVCITPKDLQ